MKTHLVSILMPVRNTAIFLPECLDSIICQSYSNWELIIVNDHSTDSSLQILEDYAQKDARINLLNNQKKGIIEALRLAYQQSTGEIITRMDSDDIMPLDKLLVLQQLLQKKGKGHVAIGLVSYFSANNLGKGYQLYEQWLNKLTITGTNFEEIYKECVIPSPCWMVYKSDLDNCGAFDSDRYPEDYDLCFRFYQFGLKCIPCSTILHLWRDSSHRASRQDPNYANNNFLDIKLFYFLKLHYDKNRPLVVWGAGKKGKYIAHFLQQQTIPFYWVCNNNNKIGHYIYDNLLYNTNKINQLQQPQLIIAIAQPQENEAIRKDFDQQELISLKDFFFFC